MRHLPPSYLLGVGLLSLSACNSGQSDSAPVGRTPPHVLRRELRKVTGSFVDFDIETYVGIDCAAYEPQFGGQNPFSITDSLKLRAILRRLAVLHPDTMGSGMDTRAKAVLFYSNQTQDTLCLDRFTCRYRGQRFRADTILYRLLGVIPKK